MKSHILLILALAICGSHPCATAAPEPSPVCKGSDPASKLVNRWFAEKKAAGLDGVFYDNRDRKHSDLRIATYPQLQPVTYSPEELARRADWGGQRKTLPGKIVIGNSSTASPANQAGSHQRMYYTHPRGLPFLHQQYRTNALYIYPEHRDHDPGTNGPDGYGDLYPANSPYLVSSQGSSGSDRVFMHAFLKTIAAFPPETRETLVKSGMLMPTLQAIFRQSYKAAPGHEGYFTGKAHPSAFEGKLIDEVAMVKLAQAMVKDAIPPLIQLQVKEEPPVVLGVDFFEPTGFLAGERLADSPCAIARVIRGPAYRRTVKISASRSADLAKRPIKFRWELLRGDPRLIEIKPAGTNGEEATISVSYHPRQPIASGDSMWSNRIDIGVFALAEKSIPSAPAFVSFTTLPSEHRTYSEEGKLLEIFYGARSRALGMPAANGDRWDNLLAEFDADPSDRSPGADFLTAVLDDGQTKAISELSTLTKPHRIQVAAADGRLAKITASLQKVIDSANKTRVAAVAAHKKHGTEQTKSALDAANAEHNAAKKRLRDGANGAAALKEKITGLREKITAAIRGSTVPEIVRSALTEIRSDPHFFSKNGAAIQAAAKESPSPKTAGSLTAALQRFKSTGVEPSDDPPANQRYHLEQLNADILCQVLFPHFLQRPPGFNYADPRLTTTKRWRDVYHYDKAGKRTGWTRYQNGEPSEFNATGQLILSRKPDGSPDQVTDVRYVIDPKTKQLVAQVVK